MLHWPDTMFTYLSGEEFLFSNDGFGQHYATESLYDDAVDEAELMFEAEKYYANILTLYSPMATRKIKEILAMNLPLKMICPSHGVIWKNVPRSPAVTMHWSMIDPPSSISDEVVQSPLISAEGNFVILFISSQKQFGLRNYEKFHRPKSI